MPIEPRGPPSRSETAPLAPVEPSLPRGRIVSRVLSPWSPSCVTASLHFQPTGAIHQLLQHAEHAEAEVAGVVRRKARRLDVLAECLVPLLAAWLPASGVLPRAKHSSAGQTVLFTTCREPSQSTSASHGKPNHKEATKGKHRSCMEGHKSQVAKCEIAHGNRKHSK